MKIMEEAYNLAKNIPTNIHLVLASFAILYRPSEQEEWGILNVVPYVECGSDPQLKLIVKNKIARGDCLYSIEGQLVPIWEKTTCSTLPTIELHGREYSFSYNNIVESKTEGGAKFYTGVNICADHEESGALIEQQQQAFQSALPISSSATSQQLSQRQESQQQRAFQQQISSFIQTQIRQQQTPEQTGALPQEMPLITSQHVANINMQAIEESAEGKAELFPIQKWLIITSNFMHAYKGSCWERTTYADRQSDEGDEPSVNEVMKQRTGSSETVD